MNLKNVLKIIGILIVFVLLQSYFTNPHNFLLILATWKSYFTTIIMSVFIAILLEPIVEFFKRKIKTNNICSIILAIIFVILIFIILFLIIIPEIISSMKEFNNIYPYVSGKLMDMSDKIINYLAEKNIYTVNTDEINNYFTNFARDNASGIQKIISLIISNVVLWTVGFTNLFLAFTLAFLILIVAPFKTLFLLIAIVVSQLVDGFIVGPKIIGDKVGLNTFWVMVSMIVFGNLFGIMGMFLGIPIMSIIKLFYDDLIKRAEQGGKE